MSSRIEQALGALATNLAALTDCTVLVNPDVPVPWPAISTGRVVCLHYGTWTPQTRTGVTTWFLASALELHVTLPTHAALGAAVATLHAEVTAVLVADVTLGGTAVFCEAAEEGEGAQIEVAAGEHGMPAAVMRVPLALVVVTTAADLAA